MEHYVKTSEGILVGCYKHSETFAKYGEDQGKASSPSNWLFQSSTIPNAPHALVSDCTYLDSKVKCKDPHKLEYLAPCMPISSCRDNVFQRGIFM
eukprot:10730896-Ditylum_brightwellii.AAC.1